MCKKVTASLNVVGGLDRHTQCVRANHVVPPVWKLLARGLSTAVCWMQEGAVLLCQTIRIPKIV